MHCRSGWPWSIEDRGICEHVSTSRTFARCDIRLSRILHYQHVFCTTDASTRFEINARIVLIKVKVIFVAKKLYNLKMEKSGILV